MPDGNGNRTTNEWLMHLDDKLSTAIDQKADKETVQEIANDVKALNTKVSRALGGVSVAWAGLTAWLGFGR